MATTRLGNHPLGIILGARSCVVWGMEDQLLQWFDVKQRLRETQRSEPVVSDWEIWWVNLGENIGMEINGKSRDFSRPAVIFKKLSCQFYLVIPTTTKPRIGSWFVPIHHEGRDMWVCLHQIRSVDYRRLRSKLGRVNATEALTIRNTFLKLL